MKRLLRISPLAIAIAASPALAQSEDDRLASMQQQIDSLRQQINTPVQDRVRFNGFMSTGVARASNDAGYAGITETTEVQDLTLAALQASFEITDEVQAVMQIISRGDDDWDTDMEWAYLSYRPNADLQLRAGKMRQPLFMYSDYMDLGYAQPWARAPQVIYGSVNSSYVGADASYTIPLDSSSITTQAFFGYIDEEIDGIALDVRNSSGISLSWTDYVWTLRSVYSWGDISLDMPPVDDERASYLGLGVSYDDGNWQIISEAARTEVDGFMPDTDAAYLSVGHRFGAFTPYVMAGWLETKDDDKRGPMLVAMNGDRTDYSVGVRWDITPGVALKADWTHSRGFEDSPSGLDAQTVLTEGLNSTNVYTFKIDAAF